VDFLLFVYGTLQRGFPAHARYCAGARALGRARVRGALFEHGDGFPVLVLYPHQVLAFGTANAVADARLAEERSARVTRPRPFAILAPPAMSASPRPIGGEVLSFPSATVPLGTLDAYEGYVRRGRSLFARVLVDVEIIGKRPSRAWTYVAGAGMRPESLTPLQTGFWRP
jgi:gamma-glutamylcyclotransferase (GGCT)/AIG2-like uncharacterized protein YtfP